MIEAWNAKIIDGRLDQLAALPPLAGAIPQDVRSAKGTLHTMVFYYKLLA
ncbi:MAG: hypothetical protein K8L99_30985 [Anaerolineae bacterium]|nr:hypothetical protein [Anaerolineae bacterium]